MTTTTDNRELPEELQQLSTELETAVTANVSNELIHTRLPWIGALPNPHLGPMIVLNDEGYFVPLFTSGDLVRACRYLWRRERD